MFLQAIYIAAIVIALHKGLLFIAGSAKKDNSIVDVFYGIAFILAAGITHMLFDARNFVATIVIVLITVWGLRLSYRIMRRHKGEDPRYGAWRAEWMQKGKLYFYIRSLLQVYVLQGIIILIVLLPTLVLISHVRVPLLYVLAVGIILWLIGFLFEAVADHQLDTFLKHPDPKPAIFTGGLYNYSRHPNYFGEALMWWAIWGIAVATVPTFWWTIISPLTITYVLTKISAPMLERSFENKEGWSEYKEKTSYFIPLPPK